MLASLTAPARWRAATSTPSSTRRGARACPRTSLPRFASTPAPRFSSSRRTARRGLLEEALESDVSDVLLLPQLVENVVFAIRKATHSTRRHHDSGGGPGRHGKIVTVFSPKGGTGKTVIATNLAAACAKFEGRKTLLLDLDLQFGDAAIMLGVEPEKTIYDLVVAPGELDTREAGRLHDEARVRARSPARAASAGRRRARDRGQARPAARGRDASRSTSSSSTRLRSSTVRCWPRSTGRTSSCCSARSTCPP